MFLDNFFCEARPRLQETFLFSLSIIDEVGLKRYACKYWDSSGFEVFPRVLFSTFSACCGPRGNSHIPVFLFMVPLITSSLLFWIDVSIFSIVEVHPSSHKTPIDIYGDMWICFVFLLRPGIWRAAICMDSVVYPYDSLAFISFSIITGDIVAVDFLARCIFIPESVIYSMLVIVGLGEVSI